MADPTGLVLNDIYAVFIVGCAGGFFFEVLKWYNLRDKITFKTYKTSPIYWLLTIVMIICGGAWAVFNGVTGVNAVIAAMLGASAPLSFAGLGNAASVFTSPSPPPAPPIPVPPTPVIHETKNKSEVGSITKFLTWR